MGSMLSDSDIRAQLNLGKGADLQIADATEECITPVGYDIRAGETIFSYAHKKVSSLSEGEYEVGPGDTVFISSMEKVCLSPKLGGFTVARLGPQLDGLQLSASSVDPTWQGELLIILTNVGRKPAKIKYKDRLMTLCLVWMNSPSAKEIERRRWNNENIRKKFREMEKEASGLQYKKIGLDLAILTALVAITVLLRRHKILETNENTILLGLDEPVSLFEHRANLDFRPGSVGQDSKAEQPSPSYTEYVFGRFL